MGARRDDKDLIHLDYVSSDISLRALSKKHGVALSTVRRWNDEDGWAAEKQAFLESAAQKARKALEAEKARLFGELTDRCTRVYSTADRLLDKANALLDLEGNALAPRDLKSLSSVLVDIMTMQNFGKDRDDEEQDGDSFVIEIVEAD